LALLRHASLQYLTSSHTFSHFFRQLNGLWQTAQVFWGKALFGLILPVPAFAFFIS